MAVRSIVIERFSITTSVPFDTVVARIDAAVSHPDPKTFLAAVNAAPTLAAVESVVAEAFGASEFMQFARIDLGAVLRKDHPGKAPRALRLMIGNPLVMRTMTLHAPDAGSYAPVTILVDERPDGVHLSYDKVASLLAPYGNAEALAVARSLDEKVERLLTVAAG
ncbi:MAG TPA: DUF302 domain-containing protein [Polyangiaceae bacterium]|jgi:hypothetical protein|nr:DUF302 domain-containing protein [Polyangiaceae bacterium]